jgi:hypothetical protein
MAVRIWGALILCWGASHGLTNGVIDLEDPSHDFAFLEVEPYWQFKNAVPLNENNPDFWRTAGEMSFPIGHIDGHYLYSSVKSTLMDQNIVYDGQKLNDGLLQRYWLSGGVFLLDSPQESATLTAAVGHNSDEANTGSKDWNSEWIGTYIEQYSPKLKAGLGLDVQQYFGKWVPYPLIFIDWRISGTTKLVWDADYAEVRRFIGAKLAFTLGARFNKEFFALKQDASYEYESTGAEAGTQYSLGKHCYLRLKYKDLFWGRELMGLPDGSMHRTWITSGQSVRLNFAYGI